MDEVFAVVSGMEVTVVQVVSGTKGRPILPLGHMPQSRHTLASNNDDEDEGSDDDNSSEVDVTVPELLDEDSDDGSI